MKYWRETLSRWLPAILAGAYLALFPYDSIWERVAYSIFGGVVISAGFMLVVLTAYLAVHWVSGNDEKLFDPLRHWPLMASGALACTVLWVLLGFGQERRIAKIASCTESEVAINNLVSVRRIIMECAHEEADQMYFDQ